MQVIPYCPKQSVEFCPVTFVCCLRLLLLLLLFSSTPIYLFSVAISEYLSLPHIGANLRANRPFVSYCLYLLCF